MTKILAQLWLATLAVLLFASAPAEAFKLTPIEMVFEPAGRGATRTFQITNAHDQPIAVEIRLAARDMSLSGEDVLSDAEDSFAVFPAQAIVLPGKSQTVRVQWLGDPAPERELAFCDIPAEHWKHIRTTNPIANPIESTFATVRLRTTKTKGCLSRMTALTLVFKLCQSAGKRWRRLDGSHQIAEIIEGVKFKDGEKLTERVAFLFAA